MKVFISHSFKDLDFANLVKKKLIESDIEVIDIDISPKVGENIAIQIEKSIQESDAYLVLISKYYLDSKWSDLELMMIYNQSATPKKGKRIFPILLDKSARIPTLLKNIAYADFTDKNRTNLDSIIIALKNQFSVDEQVEHKKIRSLLKEQEYYLKLEELEYENNRIKQQRVRKVFQWSFILILIISVATTLFIIFKGIDFRKSFDLSLNIQSIIFYMLGFLTAIIPSLYISLKSKNNKNGK